MTTGRTTYNMKDLMAGLCEILPNLNLLMASEVKIDEKQAKRIDAVFGEACEGIPLSMLFINIDGIDLNRCRFKKLSDGTVGVSEESGSVTLYEDAILCVKAIRGHVKKFQPLFVLIQNNRVIDWNYLPVEHDNPDVLLDWIDTEDAYYAFRDDNYGYLHHLAPWDSRRQDELRKMYESNGFYI